MFWEELSSAELKTGVDICEGVCVLPIGVLEKHGDHLPLGTDMYIVNAVTRAAVELSSAIVFPYYFLGQISEARHHKGTIAPSHKLIMDALLEMCDEIYRNGCKKIIIASGHGGNCHFLPFFAQMLPGINRPYAVYTCFVHNLSDELYSDIMRHCGVDDLGEHAGFTETALMMYLRPDLVSMNKVKVEESVSLGRLDAVKKTEAYSGFDWYADFPNHFAGDPTKATAEYGEYIFNILRDNLVSIIREIKKDNTSLVLIDEYNKLAK